MKHLMHSAWRRAAPPATGRLLAFLLLGMCWPLTAAGLQSGDLLGGVVDPAGERLEGVSLVLEGKGRADLETRSDADGRFRFVNLEPGDYRLRIAHESYGEIVHGPVKVRLGRTTSVRVQLNPRIRETIVVISEPPRRALTASSRVQWERSDLERIPRALDPFTSQAVALSGAAAVSESVAAVRVDGASTLADGPARLAHSQAEVQIRAGGAQVDAAGSGPVVELVTRPPAPGLRGSVDAWLGEGQSANAEDLTRERVLEVGEVGGELGGGLLGDALWGWARLRRQWLERQVVGGLRETLSEEGAALELDGRFRGSSFDFAFDHRQRDQDGEGAAPDREAEATRQITEPSQRLRLRMAHLLDRTRQLQLTWERREGMRHGLPVGDPEAATVLDARGIWSGATLFDEVSDGDLLELVFSAHRRQGSTNHEFRAGASWAETLDRRSESWGSGELQFLAGENFGLPFDLLRVRRPVHTAVERDHFALYVQDSLRRGRLTVDLGLRHDLESGRNAAGTVAAHPLFPNLLPEVELGDEGGLDWNSVTPRLGVAYALDAAGRTVLRGSYGFFSQRLDAELVRGTHPALEQVILAFGDFNQQGPSFDADPLNRLMERGAVGGTAPRVAQLEGERTDELRLSLDHEWGAATLGLELVRRRVSDVLEERRLVSDSSGTLRFARAVDYQLEQLLTGTLPDGSAYEIPIYGLQPNLEDSGQGVWLNGDRGQTYEAVTLRFDRRLSRGLALRSRLTWRDWRWRVGSEFRRYDDPTDVALTGGPAATGAETDGAPVAPLAASGNAFLDSGWSLAVHALYQLAPERPWGFDIALDLNARQGFPVPYELTALTADGSLLRVQATPQVDSVRLDDLVTLDLRLEKGFRVGDLRLTAALDAFNLLDTERVLERERRLDGALANSVRRTTSPRIFRFGLRIALR